MENNKVKVISQYNGRCGVDDIGLRVHRRWQSSGAVVTFDKEVFDELIYNPSFKYMLDTGMLYIEDMNIKQEIGLEPEGSTVPVNVMKMDKNAMERYWNILPVAQFKLEINKLSKEQLTMLAEYAISTEHGDIEKARILSKASGYNIMKGQELNRQSKEKVDDVT